LATVEVGEEGAGGFITTRMSRTKRLRSTTRLSTITMENSRGTFLVVFLKRSSSNRTRKVKDMKITDMMKVTYMKIMDMTREVAKDFSMMEALRMEEEILMSAILVIFRLQRGRESNSILIFDVCIIE